MTAFSLLFFPLAMSKEKKSAFVNVDELLPQVSLEQAAAFYGIVLPNCKRIGAETRIRCFLACGKTTETGDRALAIQTEDPARKWKCHQYGCGKGGNLVSLCDLMKPGPHAEGKPRGERFKAIAADLTAMVAGVVRGVDVPAPAPVKAAPLPEPKVNVPLKDSPNERARALVDLDQKFVTDIATMTPKASAYFRRRPFLSLEVCQRWRAGYLPRDVGGEDRSGGTMRGKIVYAYRGETGDVLTWFGRDPEFEEKHASWEATDKSEREPEKFHFVKGFHRGIELFGQHALRAEGVAEKLQGLGLIVVEGPNDVIRLDTLGVPAVALCSNLITREQAVKVSGLAREVAGGVVTVLLDCDPEGENGMKQALGYLAQMVPVRLAWTSKMYGGKFRGRQPESLSSDEWTEIKDYLMTGRSEGWTLS
jgi:5S rRNA maturation endonuclease (ribonuclease M5)